MGSGNSLVLISNFILKIHVKPQDWAFSSFSLFASTILTEKSGYYGTNEKSQEPLITKIKEVSDANHYFNELKQCQNNNCIQKIDRLSQPLQKF